MHTMTCRNCGAGLDTGAVDSQHGVITCAHCGSLHERLSSVAGDDGSTASSGRANGSGATMPAMIVKPTGFEHRKSSGEDELVWPAGSPTSAVVLTLFALLWIGLTVTTGLWFLTPVGVLLLYLAAVRGFNRNRLFVGRQHIVFRRGPLPWPGSKTVPREPITQVFARELRSVNRTVEDGRERRQVRLRYRLEALNTDDTRTTLVSGLEKPEQALWLERQIEQLMGIQDREVAGSFRG